MKRVSRRRLAQVVVAELRAGKPSARLVRSLAAYLVDHKMTSQVSMLMNDIASEYAQQTGQLDVEITSVHRLTESLQKELQHYFMQQTGAKKVHLHQTFDQQLIGGLIARTPDAELDLSVRRTLTKLRA